MFPQSVLFWILSSSGALFYRIYWYISSAKKKKIHVSGSLIVPNSVAGLMDTLQISEILKLCRCLLLCSVETTRGESGCLYICPWRTIDQQENSILTQGQEWERDASCIPWGMIKTYRHEVLCDFCFHMPGK